MTETLEKLENERTTMVTRIFWLGLEIALIFAVPAALVVIFGRQLPGNGIYFLLLGAFVFSWTITILRWRRMSKKMRELDRKIRELKKEISEDK